MKMDWAKERPQASCYVEGVSTKLAFTYQSQLTCIVTSTYNEARKLVFLWPTMYPDKSFRIIEREESVWGTISSLYCFFLPFGLNYSCLFIFIYSLLTYIPSPNII